MLNRDEMIDKLLDRDGDKCMLCGKPFIDRKGIALDCILPVSKDYGKDFNNLQLVCQRCDIENHNKLWSSNERQFTLYLKELLILNDKYADVSTDYAYMIGRKITIRIDLTFTRKTDNKRIIAEVDNNTSYTEIRINKLIESMSAYQKMEQTADLVLIIPGTLPDDYKVMLNKAGIELWDRNYIANTFQNEISELKSPMFTDMFRIITEEEGNKFDDMISALKKCPSGLQDWPMYQKLIGRIIGVLFCPPLNMPIEERSDANMVNRKDFILPNYVHDGFWKFMRERYCADYIVVDAKNSGKTIVKKDVLQISNYLKEHGAGLFAMIFSRKGLAKNTYYVLSELWGLDKKLIIVLDDNDVEQMLLEKKNDGNPEKVIQKKIEDFRLSI